VSTPLLQIPGKGRRKKRAQERSPVIKKEKAKDYRIGRFASGSEIAYIPGERRLRGKKVTGGVSARKNDSSGRNLTPLQVTV